MRNPIYIVTGHPRSGTSMMMKMLEAGGLPVATDGVRVPDESNPNGYYELEAIKRLQSMEPTEKHDLFFEFQGKVAKVVLPLLMYIPMQFDYKIVHIKRDIDEMLRSQASMTGEFPHPRLRDAFQNKERQVIDWMKLNRMDWNTFHYDLVLNNPKLSANYIDVFIGGLDTDKMAAVVDPNLNHQAAIPF